MTEQDDAFPLPQPPPPAPARREAAIEEALRRFDAGGKAPNTRPTGTEPRQSGSRWGISNRPQLGVLVAASLVAVIGLPLAWLTVTQKTEPSAEMASRDAADVRIADVARPRLPSVVFEPTAAPPEAPASSDAQPPATATQEAAESEVATRLAEVKATRETADNKGGRQDMVLAQAGITAAPVVTAPPPPPAAAPPARAKAEARAAAERREQFADVQDVIVTAQRRRGRDVPERGDWNACTIEDPMRSLAACKSLVNPASRGLKGEAAARIADGLLLAWQGDMIRAITAFDQAIAIMPKSPLAYLNRGLAWHQHGDSGKALSDLNEAVRLSPGSARAYYNRGRLLRELGDVRRARADQRRAVDLDAAYEVVIEQQR